MVIDPGRAPAAVGLQPRHLSSPGGPGPGQVLLRQRHRRLLRRRPGPLPALLPCPELRRLRLVRRLPLCPLRLQPGQRRADPLVPRPRFFAARARAFLDQIASASGKAIDDLALTDAADT